MEAREFRIGNLIHKSIKSGKGRTIIDNTGCQDLVRIHENIGSFNYEPIPLTEEWLIKFGFEKLPTKDYFTLYLSDKDESEFGRQRIDYWFGEDDFSAAELCRAGVCFKRVKIKYVHQLQNLYFALTGTELTPTT